MTETATTGRVVPYLVELFRFQCWVAMGKIVNPATQEIERDLTAAKSAIDLLGELERKTQGNLSDEEQKFLQGALTELRLNYVDEANKGETPPAPESATDAETANESEHEQA